MKIITSFLARLSRRHRGELVVYQSSRRPSVRACVRVSTFSNMNISETGGLIAIKLYLKHHWGVGKASVGFDPGQIRTLVSIATDSSNRGIMGKTTSSRFLSVFDRILFILAGNDNMHESLDEFEIWLDSTADYGVSCP